jgi:hypothetical protein
MRVILLLVFGILCSVSPTPSELASLVTKPVFGNSSHFLVWDYGGAVITDSFWEFADYFHLDTLVTPLNNLLNSMTTNTNQDGYKILHNIDIPFGGAVGDSVGLYPISYLSRAAYYNNHPDPKYNNETDLKITEIVSNKYILGWPKHLTDGTISRSSGWSGEPAGSKFLWDDDMYMGLTLISRVAAYQKNSTLANIAGKMQLTFATHSMDTSSSLFWHGFNDADQHHSCCKWGRGNGWLMMSHIEVLKALKATSDTQYYSQVISLLQAHSKGLMEVQSSTGLWHQVLDQTSTYLETSATSMYLWSIAEGINEGWLDKAVYGPVVEKAWTGLQTTINAEGTVSGVCEGTGIGTTVQFYEDRGTSYLSSSPGLGSVFKAITAYARFTAKK